MALFLRNSRRSESQIIGELTARSMVYMMLWSILMATISFLYDNSVGLLISDKLLAFHSPQTPQLLIIWYLSCLTQ